MTAERSLKLILLKKCLLAFFGLCAGGIIAAGVYAFLAIIGVFVRLMGEIDTFSTASLITRTNNDITQVQNC